MKKWLLMTLLTVLFATPAQAKDACSTVLCMAGLLQGSGVVNGCKGFVNNYFSIVKFNSHGGISLNKTFKARGRFLNKCESNGGWAQEINKKYGRLL